MVVQALPILGQIICKGVPIVYFVILVCLCVRGIAYLKFPKVSLKNIEYCLCSTRQHVFSLDLRNGKRHVGHVQPVPKVRFWGFNINKY